jgi:hypothetical protein
VLLPAELRALVDARLATDPLLSEADCGEQFRADIKHFLYEQVSI